MNSPVEKNEPHAQNGPLKASDFYGRMLDPAVRRSLVRLPDHFKVSGDGVFFSLQGEGPTMGWPACFLRLHFCNLRCTWCDAWYTWMKSTEEFWTESVDWTIGTTREKIEAAWSCDTATIPKRLVVTGGEPLIQQNHVQSLVEQLPDWAIEIETNGTIMPTDGLLERAQFNCSPKLKNSENEGLKRIYQHVLQTLNEVNTCFKFVVRTVEDIEEIDRDFVGPFGLDRRKVIIMPEGVTPQELEQTTQSILEAVQKRGYRLMGRLQCELLGGGRRV